MYAGYYDAIVYDDGDGGDDADVCDGDGDEVDVVGAGGIGHGDVADGHDVDGCVTGVADCAIGGDFQHRRSRHPTSAS